MESKSRLGRRRVAARHEKNNASYLEKHQEVIAAASGIFLQKGYENTKLKDIAEALGMDRATLYYYASSKKDLFDEVLKNASEKNVNFIEELVQRKIPAREKLVLAIDSLMRSYRQDYPYLAIFLQQYLHASSEESAGLAQESGSWGRRYYVALRSIIQEGLKNGEFAFSLPVGIATNAVIGMINWIHLAKGPNAGKTGQSDRRNKSDDLIDQGVSLFILKALSD
ncbi:MAG: TetR/AcrR family transcriptional regulator [Qipengyuania pacifica]